MIFEGFEFPCSQSKSIKNRLQVELARKCAPRRPQDASRRPQDAPTTPQDSQDGPKTRPRRPQDAPRRPPGADNFRLKSVFLADPLPNLNFGPSWARFWKVFASILGGVLGGCKEFQTHKIPKHLGCFGLNFEKCFGWLLRAENTQNTKNTQNTHNKKNTKHPHPHTHIHTHTHTHTHTQTHTHTDTHHKIEEGKNYIK